MSRSAYHEKKAIARVRATEDDQSKTYDAISAFLKISDEELRRADTRAIWAFLLGAGAATITHWLVARILVITETIP